MEALICRLSPPLDAGHVQNLASSGLGRASKCKSIDDSTSARSTSSSMEVSALVSRSYGGRDQVVRMSSTDRVHVGRKPNKNSYEIQDVPNMQQKCPDLEVCTSRLCAQPRGGDRPGPASALLAAGAGRKATTCQITYIYIYICIYLYEIEVVISVVVVSMFPKLIVKQCFNNITVMYVAPILLPYL